MSLFWHEFLFFAASMFGILVAFSTANLFYQTLRAEHQVKTAWRAAGFLLLVFGLLLFVLERKYGFFGFFGVVVECLGYFFIYRGVKAQPRLSPLTKVRKEGPGNGDVFMRKLLGSIRTWFVRLMILIDIIVIIGAVLWILVRWVVPPLGAVLLAALGGVASFVQANFAFVPSLVILVSLVFIILTIRLQVRRYREESMDRQIRRNNFYPLAGYVFLAIRAVAHAGYRLPKIDLIWTRFFNGAYSTAWIIAALATLLGFFFLALWAWRFIRVRFFLRTYVVFLALSIAVATASVLIFSLLIFQVVESNNLDLMERGARTEALIMVERKNVAETLARLISADPGLISGSTAFSPNDVRDRAEFFRQQTNVDVIRFYSPQREVLSSPTDRRDVGRVFSDDALLLKVIERGIATSSFDVVPGVLSDVLVGRALYPITEAPLPALPASASEGDRVSSKPVVRGVVEVAYVYDNAFVDYSKRETGLEVTMYSKAERSASTIRTADGTSRWVGSNETEPAVLSRVLGDGEEYQTALDRLGTPYYSAFIPIRNAHHDIIGMVSVGVPTHILLEDARQRFLTSFFLATLISFIAAIAGFFAFRNFERNDPTN